ncbi:MAG: beta-propeller fold lactonase family protein [Gammaproteobacteria bacterium]
MTSITRIGSLALAGAALLALSPAFAQDGTLLVVNRHAGAGSVSLFDLQTETEIARVPIGAGWPHEVAVSPNGRLAVTAEYGEVDPGRYVVVMDIPNARVLGRIDMGPGMKPHDSVFLPDNRHAVVTLETIDEIAIVDVETLTVVRTYPIGDAAREGHMIWLSPDGSRVYVGGRLGEGTVSVVYLDDDREPAVIQTGLGAEAITVTPDGDNVWIINQDDNTISIIDPDSLAIRETFDAATQPRRLANLPDGRMAVVYGNSSDVGIRIYDTESLEVLADLDIPGEEVGAGGFGFFAIGNTGYVSTRQDGRILVYDFSNPEETPSTLVSGHVTPDGMAWTPLRLDVFDAGQD